MNTDWTGICTCKEFHKTKSRWNYSTTDRTEEEELEDRRNVGKNSSNSGDGTDQTGPVLDVYEIIALQTARKKNNWKTEETLARTVVTLETERIKLVQYLMFMKL